MYEARVLVINPNPNVNLLSQAKEVKETKDHKEAALLVQSGNWVIVNAAFQGDDILWALIRL